MSEGVTSTYLDDLLKHEGRIEKAFQIHKRSVPYGADRISFEAGYEAACSYFWNLPKQSQEYSEYTRLMGDERKGE